MGFNVRQGLRLHLGLAGKHEESKKTDAGLTVRHSNF